MCYPLRQVAVDRPTAFSTDAAVFLHQSAELYVAVDEEREISLKTQKKNICYLPCWKWYDNITVFEIQDRYEKKSRVLLSFTG